MHILGISAFYHDSAAALVEDGRIVAAAQEERFTRKKHDFRFPESAIAYCLSEAGLTLNEIERIAFFEKPFVKFERLLETYLASAPKGFFSFRKAMPVWLKQKLFQKSTLVNKLKALGHTEDIERKLLFAEHHQSHAAAAFFPSPFDDALILTLDGVGEWTTASVAVGKGNTITTVKEIKWPHSLGLLYSAFTYYIGFRVNSGEYKVMGLAPYGVPTFAERILQHVVHVAEDGSFWMDQSYFNYAAGLTMTNAKFHRLFDGPPRQPKSPLTQREMDLAASVQHVTEQIMLRMTRDLSHRYGMTNLCLAGGVALNCVANGKILRDKSFERIWVQPAAGDAGSAVGAALAAYHQHLNKPRIRSDKQDGMEGSFLGPSFTQSQIETRLAALGARFKVLDDAAMQEEAVSALEAGHAVGWMQGRMEFGPRALGNRSILGDPRKCEMQRQLNLKIKYRESFRPFAPAVLAEDVNEYFEFTDESPYMTFVANVRSERCLEMTESETALFGIDKLNLPRSDIPAVTHVDYSARIQTVHAESNPRFHALISAFKRRTGCAVLVNTSFNIRGEPIVCTPEDAFRCFMGTEIELLVVGNCVLRKQDQTVTMDEGYHKAFALD